MENHRKSFQPRTERLMENAFLKGMSKNMREKNGRMQSKSMIGTEEMLKRQFSHLNEEEREQRKKRSEKEQRKLEKQEKKKLEKLEKEKRKREKKERKEKKERDVNEFAKKDYLDQHLNRKRISEIIQKDFHIGEQKYKIEIGCYYCTNFNYHYDRNSWVYGVFVVTNGRILFYELREIEKGRLIKVLDEFDSNIYKVDKYGGKTGVSTALKGNTSAFQYQLILHLKSVRIVRIALNPLENSRNNLANLLKSEKRMEFSFAFSFRLRSDKQIEHHQVYTKEKEFGLRQGIIDLPSQELAFLQSEFPKFRRRNEKSTKIKTKWIVNDMNSKYEAIPTYPKELIVPKITSEETLNAIMLCRSKGRLPILTYANRNTGISITRSAQPLVGLNLSKKVSPEDEQYLNEILSLNKFKKPLVIVDVRPRINAEANRLKGGGTEKNYKNVEVHLMGIENIHVMRTSMEKLMKYCLEEAGGSKFYDAIVNSEWLKHIRLCLRASLFSLKALEEDKKSILIHCSDGWDRTSQTSALTQILLDPYFRTMEGFAVIVEKDWLKPGHKFKERLDLGVRNESKFFKGGSQASPIFLQFLECVSVLMKQHPTSFEFNEQFLIFIMDEAYACRFGNFLYDCEKDRDHNLIYSQTEDIWNYIFNPKYDTKKQFMNPFYNPIESKKNRVILPDLRFSSITFWDTYWLRYARPTNEKISMNPFSPFFFHNSFQSPYFYFNQRGLLMINEISSLVKDNMLFESKNEIELFKKNKRIRKLTMENEKLKKKFEEMKKLVDKKEKKQQPKLENVKKLPKKCLFD